MLVYMLVFEFPVIMYIEKVKKRGEVALGS